VRLPPLGEERGVAPLLLIAFIVVPVLELWIISLVADRIQLLPTLALLLVVSVVGAWLVKREGRAAWNRFREALGQRIPSVEVVDGALVLVGGTLLLTPGFLTDTVGLLLVIPPTRAVANRMIRSRVRGTFGLGPAGPGRPPPPAAADPIDVEVVDVKRNPNGQPDRRV
jgi:UPF0716 protein FxsA